MRMTNKVPSCLVLLVCLCGTHGYMRVCYYTNWSQFSPNYGLLPLSIPAELCTHFIFAYADVRAANLTPTEFNDFETYARLNRMKEDNPTLQVILAVGGWAAGGDKFSRLVSSEASMSQFASSVVSYVRSQELDGVHIDWQYPTLSNRGSDILDRERFTRLLRILRSQFQQEATAEDRVPLSLSASLEADVREAVTFYQIPEIGQLLDFACIMTYDLHGQWDSRLGALHHSPLEPDIRTYVSGWIQAGFPVQKLVLTVAGFGRSFTLRSEPRGTGVGQPVVAGGTPGAFSGETGLLDYGEICLHTTRDGWTELWLDDHRVPVAFGNTSSGWQWVGFDDPRSLTEKAVFIRRQGLAGVAFWTIEHDDFSNLCNNGTWPLLRTLERELPTNSSLAPLVPDTRPPELTPLPTDSSTKQATQSPLNHSRPSHWSPALQPTSESNASHTDNPHDTTHPVNPPDTSTRSTWLTGRPGAWVPRWKGGWPHQGPKIRPGFTTYGPASTVDVGQGDHLGFKLHKSDWTCKIADVYGPSLTCPQSKGRPGDRSSFYLYCSPGFMAIQCRCPLGHFYNRCLQVCDVESHFNSCPLLH